MHAGDLFLAFVNLSCLTSADELIRLVLSTMYNQVLYIARGPHAWTRTPRNPHYPSIGLCKSTSQDVLLQLVRKIINCHTDA